MMNVQAMKKQKECFVKKEGEFLNVFKTNNNYRDFGLDVI